MVKYILKFIILIIISSCSYNSSFYYTKSEYNEIKDIKYEDIYLENEQGSKLNAVYLEPEGEIKGAVLLIHGNGGNVSGWINSIEPLAKAGYRTLVFDYQGYGKSEGKPTHKNVVTDSELFLNYLISRKASKNEKLVVWGVSLGGNLSVNIANRNQDKIDALIDEAGFSSHSDIGTEFMPWILKPIARLSIKSPYKSKVLISELKMPILIIHSIEDKVVPFKMGEKVFANANEPKEFWQIKGKHCYAIRDYETQFIQKLESLILEN